MLSLLPEFLQVVLVLPDLNQLDFRFLLLPVHKFFSDVALDILQVLQPLGIGIQRFHIPPLVLSILPQMIPFRQSPELNSLVLPVLID